MSSALALGAVEHGVEGGREVRPRKAIIPMKSIIIIVAVAVAACGGNIATPDDAGEPSVCDVAYDGSEVTGPFVCGVTGNVYWTWSDDAGAHACEQTPCPSGAACVVHSHSGVCR